MTAPANKKRIHNDAARAAKQNIAGGGSERTKRVRSSRYGDRIAALREKAVLKELIRKAQAEQTTGEEE